MERVQEFSYFAKVGMLNSNYKKTLLSISFFVFVMGLTISKLKVSDSLNSNVAGTLLNNENKVGSGSQNPDLDESTSRVYFSIFKFVSNLVPAGSSN